MAQTELWVLFKFGDISLQPPLCMYEYFREVFDYAGSCTDHEQNDPLISTSGSASKASCRDRWVCFWHAIFEDQIRHVEVESHMWWDHISVKEEKDQYLGLLRGFHLLPDHISLWVQQQKACIGFGCQTMPQFVDTEHLSAQLLWLAAIAARILYQT